MNGKNIRLLCAYCATMQLLGWGLLHMTLYAVTDGHRALAAMPGSLFLGVLFAVITTRVHLKGEDMSISWGMYSFKKEEVES